MPSDVDWVGRELQRLAAEKKLLRPPTEAEWNAIWRAATDWADAYGVVATGMAIDEFVRKHAPGVLAESTPDPAMNRQTHAEAALAPAPGTARASEIDPRERGRRYPRITGRGKPAAKAAGFGGGASSPPLSS